MTGQSRQAGWEVEKGISFRTLLGKIVKDTEVDKKELLGTLSNIFFGLNPPFIVSKLCYNSVRCRILVVMQKWFLLKIKIMFCGNVADYALWNGAILNLIVN